MRQSYAGRPDHRTSDLIKIARRLFLRRRREEPFWQKQRKLRLQRTLVRKKSKENLALLTHALLLVALVLVVYLPVLPGSFVMDDKRLVTDGNPIFTGELTSHSVWFQTDFPLTLCAWSAQWLMWGDNPGGYHAVNILLQAVSALLLWRVLARLKIPGAWLAGAIFAVHPVCVGSVARIAELKIRFHCHSSSRVSGAYLRYENATLYTSDEKPEDIPYSQRQGTLWFTLSMVAFVLALLSKTTTLMLPLALLACAAWQRGRITRRDLVHTAPYFLLSLSFGLMSVWFQKYQALAGEILPPESFAQRVATAGRDFWFYCGKAILPINLTVFYSRWQTNLPLLEALLPALMMAALFAVCWRFRHTWGKHALFGLGCFTVLLFPALGFFDAQCFTKFQVSDHLQYLPMIALVSLAAGVMASVLRKKQFQYAATGVILVLSLLAFQRARAFSTQERLLRDTLAKNPAAWPAHNDVGVIDARNGHFAEAATHFEIALQFHPNDPDLLANLGMAYAAQGRLVEASAEYHAAIKLKPASRNCSEQLSSKILEQQGNNSEAVRQIKIALHFTPKTENRLRLAGLLYEARDFSESVGQYRSVLALDPDDTTALNNLAFIFINCPDKTAIKNAVIPAVPSNSSGTRLSRYRLQRTLVHHHPFSRLPRSRPP